jgi:2-C-methyl-D-erythritol 4-phosphate cytidylyltransferase
VVQCLIVVAPGDQETFRRRYGANLVFLNIQVASGGKERFDSVANALAMLTPEVEYVAIHDAVRPCVTAAQIDAVFAKAAHTGAAMLGVPVTDTLKRATPEGAVTETVSREGYWLAQTPQVFRKDWLLDAYARRDKLKTPITDDAQLLEALGKVVHVVNGSTSNLKITTREDLALAEAILKSRPKPKGEGVSHPFGEEAQW